MTIQKPFLRDARNWNALLAGAALAISVWAWFFWSVQLAVTGTSVALIANCIGRRGRS